MMNVNPQYAPVSAMCSPGELHMLFCSWHQKTAIAVSDVFFYLKGILMGCQAGIAFDLCSLPLVFLL